MSGTNIGSILGGAWLSTIPEAARNLTETKSAKQMRFLIMLLPLDLTVDVLEALKFHRRNDPGVDSCAWAITFAV